MQIYIECTSRALFPVILQPYHRNFNKRLIKSPKLYFYDTGLACSLLGILQAESVLTHHLYGSLFENLVIGDIIKNAWHQGRRPALYYWRESNGTEIDCLFEKEPGKITAVEIKGGETFTTGFLKNLNLFERQAGKVPVEKWVIYAGDERLKLADAQILSWQAFRDGRDKRFSLPE